MTELDCTGMNCPLPIVRISQAMRQITAGELLRVTASDPAFGADVSAWVRKTGHELVEFSDQGVQTAVIRKAAS